MKQIRQISYNGEIVHVWKPLTLFEFMGQPIDKLNAEDKKLRARLEESLFGGKSGETRAIVRGGDKNAIKRIS